MKLKLLIATVLVFSSQLTVAATQAEQTLSERVGQLLQQRADSHLNADLNYQSFELITLTGELRVQGAQLRSRVSELDAGLNEVLRAESIVVKGQWLTAQKNNLVLESITASDAQLTIAYFGKGQSNLHALYDAAAQQQRLQRTQNPLLWQVKESRLNDVVLNLFDNGYPILSVRLAALQLPRLTAEQTANDYISALLWPVLEQVLEQVMAGESEAVVDVSRLTQFVWREIR